MRDQSPAFILSDFCVNFYIVAFLFESDNGKLKALYKVQD